MTTKIETMTNEELAAIIQSGSDRSSEAYSQLFLNMKPTILGEAEMYKGRMTTYDTDDFLQEGFILIWKTMKNFKGGSYKNYFISAMRFRLCKIYETYITKNPICIAQTEDFRGYGYTVSILVESEKAQEYRAKKNERQRRYAAKKRAERAAMPKPKKLQPTEEEKAAKATAAAESHKKANLDYYNKHKEEMNRKRREKRAAAKAAKLQSA